MAEKSFEQCEAHIQAYTKPGDSVWDVFGGTCSMGCMCIKTNRKVVGSEKDRSTLELATKRMLSMVHGQRLTKVWINTSSLDSIV
jgi:DNA modification methylase